MKKGEREIDPVLGTQGKKISGKVRKVLNTRLLAWTLIVLAIVGPAVYLIFRWQISHTAKAIRDQAEAYCKEEKWPQAADYYFRYLELNPHDSQARIQLAETYARAFPGSRRRDRTIDLFYQALGVAPPEQQARLRRQLGDLLLQSGVALINQQYPEKARPRFAAAETEARSLLTADSKDPAAWRILAFSLVEQYKLGSRSTQSKAKETVAGVFEQAVKRNPNHIELSSTLAEIYRKYTDLLDPDQKTLSEADRARLADSVMERMVAAASQNPEAHLARYRYRMQYKLPQAEEDLREALARGPKNPEVLLTAADHARREALSLALGNTKNEEIQKGLAKARDYYERAIEAAPQDARGYLDSGEVCLELHQPDQAVEVWQRGLKQCRKVEDLFRLNSRLAEILMDQGHLEQAERSLRAMQQVRKNLDPAAPPKIKASIERLCDLRQAKLLLRRHEVREAMPLLKSVARGPRSTPDEFQQTLQAWQLLGEAYTDWKQGDRAASAYEEATRLQPQNVLLRITAAQAWANAGRPEMTIRHCHQALALRKAPEIWLMLSQALFRQQMRLPQEERNWEPFQKAIAAAEESEQQPSLKDPWRLQLLKLEFALITAEGEDQRQERIREAAEALQGLENQYPESTALLQSLVPAYERLGRSADADRILAKLEHFKDQPTADFYLLQARILAGRRQPDQAREALQAGLKSLPPEQQAPLREAILRIDTLQGRSDQVRNQLKKWCEQSPADPEPVLRLAEYALANGDWKELEACEEQFRQREGADSISARYYEAQRLLGQAKSADDPNLIQAAAAQDSVQKERPQWPAAFVLNGMVLEAEGSISQAAEAYQDAIRLGENNPAVFERLVTLLSRLDRPQEANRYLAILQNSVAAPASLAGLEMDLALRQGELDQALHIARRNAQQHLEDAFAQLWLGQVLQVNGQKTEAEKAFREAMRLAPQNPRVISRLLSFYLNTDQRDRANEVFASVKADQKLPELEKCRLLAENYELFGDRQQAEKYYREAAEKDPDPDTGQFSLAMFLLRTGGTAEEAEAERWARDTLQRNPQFGRARRLLAQILIDRGGEKEWREAEKLLSTTEVGGSGSSLDQQMEILSLLRRGGTENFKKAQRLLEKRIADPRLVSASDRLILARTLELQGKPDEARQQLLRLVQQAKPRPVHLAVYVDFLLRHERVKEAEEWVQKLEQAAPDDFGTVAVRARWLAANGQPAEIEPLVDGAATRILNKPPKRSQADEAQFCLQVGNLYAALEHYPSAEQWFRRVKELLPERYEPLALVLAQQNRVAEAIALCSTAAAADASSSPAATLTLIFLSSKPTAEDFQKAEPVFAKALNNHPQDTAFLRQLANVRVVEQRTDEAVALYQKVLQLQPHDVLSLNNLATLLSEVPSRRKEGLKYIDEAIRFAGPQPMLLDTKAMLLFHEKQWQDAAALLQQASALPEADPRYAFHLALAYQRAGEKDKAREALARAQKGQLNRKILTPMDRQLLSELEQKLKP
jgi:tetratricopeptide (TPR) repeat protein